MWKGFVKTNRNKYPPERIPRPRGRRVASRPYLNCWVCGIISDYQKEAQFILRKQFLIGVKKNIGKEPQCTSLAK
jgi:hypothetical protein